MPRVETLLLYGSLHALQLALFAGFMWAYLRQRRWVWLFGPSLVLISLVYWFLPFFNEVPR